MRKNLLITGASRGIGRATAVLAAAGGWTVGVNYRSDRAAAPVVRVRRRRRSRSTSPRTSPRVRRCPPVRSPPRGCPSPC